MRFLFASASICFDGQKNETAKAKRERERETERTIKEEQTNRI